MVKKRNIIGKTIKIEGKIKYLWAGKGMTPSGWINYDIGKDWFKKSKR